MKTGTTRCWMMPSGWYWIWDRLLHPCCNDVSVSDSKEQLVWWKLWKNWVSWGLHNSEIAATIGCTREMVRIVLKKHGVPKRNKWEGHISLDPRYYKCVK